MTFLSVYEVKACPVRRRQSRPSVFSCSSLNICIHLYIDVRMGGAKLNGILPHCILFWPILHSCGRSGFMLAFRIQVACRRTTFARRRLTELQSSGCLEHLLGFETELRPASRVAQRQVLPVDGYKCPHFIRVSAVDCKTNSLIPYTIHTD